MKWHISVLSLISCSVILVCAESNQCPDSKAVCPEATTCCQLNNNTFGCCPVENAVCCKDSIHCCPVGYSCDIEKGVCKLEGKSVSLLEKVPSTSVSVSYSGVPLHSLSVILTKPKLYVHVAGIYRLSYKLSTEINRLIEYLCRALGKWQLFYLCKAICIFYVPHTCEVFC